MYDVAVIGAGVTGALILRELSKYDISLCMLEKCADVSMGASKANSGIVHAGYDAAPGTLKALYNLRGAIMMENTTRELGVKYKKNGSIVIAFSESEMNTVRGLYERGRKNGVRDIEIVERDRLLKLEPGVSKNAYGALHAPSGAIICPYQLTVAAIGNAMDNGAALKTDFEVLDIEEHSDFFEISSENTTVRAKCVVNAAGVFADGIAKMAGDDSFSIAPRRGQYIVLDKACGDIVRHTVFSVPGKEGKGILVTPTVDGNILIGPTAEAVRRKDNTEITPAGIERLIQSASKYMESIPFDKVITSFAGLRATPDTGDFIINSPKRGFINAAGIDSPGLTASPAIAESVADMVRAFGIELRKKTDFNPKRKIFKAQRSKYHKIVCRCEGISEGEIIECIHTNPPARNADAVKMRVRAGMGRCQGGFCLPSVLEILSSELGVPPTKITKSGGGSYILTGRTK